MTAIGGKKGRYLDVGGCEKIFSWVRMKEARGFFTCGRSEDFFATFLTSNERDFAPDCGRQIFSSPPCRPMQKGGSEKNLGGKKEAKKGDSSFLQKVLKCAAGMHLNDQFM